MTQSKVDLPNPGDRLVDRYTIIERVSLGGFGAVYRAMQDNLGREIALKVLQPDVVSTNADYVEQFRQEALLTSQLRHPNTITIFDYGQTDTGLLFLVMEWLEGKTLTDVLKDEGALSYERCLHISNQILKSLSEAHERGMVHRDLKPANLMLCVQYGESDFVKVLDFGLVKNLSEETLSVGGKAVDAPKFTAKRRAPGTPHYMAPEQAMGKGTTTSADIYSFGLILYEMMTGKRAVDGTDKMDVLLRQVRQPIPPLPDDLKDTFLGRVVVKCVEKDPLKRPQNAGVLLRDYQLNEETRGIEINNADVEAQARWKSLAEPHAVSEASSAAKSIFVGRTAEIEEFRSIVNKGMNDSTGMVLVVTGQTGIGKSSLVTKFSDIFVEQTCGMLINASFMPQTVRSFSAIRAALKQFLNIQSDNPSDAQIETKRALAKYDITDAYLITFMAHFTVGKHSQGRDEREQTELRLEEFFDLLTRVSPVMLSIENIHWADTESLNLIWKLALTAVNKRRPFFMVCTYRNQAYRNTRELQMLVERLNRLDHVYYREMQLAWLGKKDCAAIVDNIIKMQRPMANKCIALSKGNPLHLDLVLRYILDEKATSDDAQKLVLPNAIESIALKRIDQVVRKYKQAEYREVLRRAALMGESFSVTAVEALMRREGQYGLLDITGRTLDVWRREGVLRKQGDKVGAFEFIHPSLVEYFNADSDASLHKNVALTKEALSSSELFIDLEDIASHFKHAGDRQNAIRYLGFAANASLQSSNLIRARKLYEKMIPLFNESTSVDEKKNVYHQLADLTLRLSELGPAKDYFNMTLSFARASGDHQLEGMALCGIADVALAQNHLDEANSNYNNAKLALPDENPNVHAKLLLGMGKISKLKADWQAALSCFQRAYEQSSNAANFDLMGNALYELGEIYINLGAARQAHECFLNAQKNYQTVNNTADEASVLLALSTTYNIFMRPDDAHNANESAIEIFQKLGDKTGFANAIIQMSNLNIQQLNFDEAQKFVLRGMPLFKDCHDDNGMARCQALLSRIELAHGQMENAMTLADQALAQYLKTDNFRIQVEFYIQLGTLYLYQNAYDTAHNYFNQAEMLLDVHQSNASRSLLYQRFGLLSECRGDFASANQYYQSALQIAQQFEYAEEAYLTRLETIKISLFFNPGRWYYDELLRIANETRTYGLKNAQLQSLLYLVWFEGVYGEQRIWENLVSELSRFVQAQRLPQAGMLRIFEFKSEPLKYVSPEVSSALLRASGWVRQCLSQISGT